MKVNLHLHSKYSDGTQWPEEIVARARSLKLEQVALTDHDFMEGVNSFLQAATAAGIEAVAGVEIDCAAAEIDYNSEVLGYFPGGRWQRTRALCLDRIKHRCQRIKTLIRRAAEYYQASLSFEELEANKLGILPPGLKDPLVTFGKPDLFAYLKMKKLISTNLDYGEYKVLPFLVRDPDPKPTVKQVIATIVKDGGIPVLPHPALIFQKDVDRMAAKARGIFHWFKEAGIRAVECNYYKDQDQDHTLALNTLTQKFAAALGLKITWGSDCHGCAHDTSNTMDKFWGSEKFPFIS